MKFIKVGKHYINTEHITFVEVNNDKKITICFRESPIPILYLKDNEAATFIKWFEAISEKP